MSSDEEQSLNESLNEIIHPEGDSPNQSATGSIVEDDNKSTSSTLSATKIARECFICGKELQRASIYKHKKTSH